MPFPKIVFRDFIKTKTGLDCDSDSLDKFQEYLQKNNIEFETVIEKHPLIIQIDLQEPMQIDSVFLNANIPLFFKRLGNAWYVAFPPDEDKKIKHTDTNTSIESIDHHSQHLVHTGEGHETVME